MLTDASFHIDLHRHFWEGVFGCSTNHKHVKIMAGKEKRNRRGHQAVASLSPVST